MKFANRFLALAGLAVWWLLSLLLFEGWLGMVLAITAIFVLAVVCIRFRSNPEVVTLWIPVMVLTGFSTLASILVAFTALAVILFYQAQSLFGSLSSVVFVAAAVPMGLVGVIAGILLFLCFRFRPSHFPNPLSGLSALNTLAMCVFIVINQQTAFILARDPIIVHVLDSQDRPLRQVTVHYASYTTRSDGETESEPEESGALTTDETGVVQLAPDHDARHVVLDLSKVGYKKIKAILVNDDVTMGEQGYRDIHVQLNDQKQDAAQTKVSNKHPVDVKLYLPSDMQTPLPLRHLKFVGTWTPSGVLYLNLKDGKMSTDPGGDLKFQIVDETAPKRLDHLHFKVTALNGAEVAPGSSVDLVKGLTFNQLLTMAPLDHYSNTLIVDWCSRFYSRSLDCKRYFRIDLDDMGTYNAPFRRGPKGDIYFGATDSRILYFDPSLEIK